MDKVRLWRAADRGDIVLGWLTKVVVTLSVLGVLGFDGISLLQARVRVADTADNAALAARDAWQDTHNGQLAYAAAESTAAESGDTVPVKGVVIEPDGAVSVEVNGTASTFVLRHISKLKKLANVTGRGRARPVT